MPEENNKQTKEKVVNREIEDEMKESYLSYSMSVIVGRALPDVRDGLKPVHRRILFAMNEMGMFHNKPYKKSARIVGECLGKYHPHGDTAVYDSMVRMAQTFSLRYPLINSQGNFGSIDGDSAAAMRYTEARLNKLAEEMLQDIDKKTVKFVPNFDESLTEPTVLPSKLPNLLLNGSSGIAVGMATSIPPHNLNEVCTAITHQIDNPEIPINEILQIIKGPDFPTGGLIEGRTGIFNAYSSGRGRITVKAKVEVEESKKDKKRIIITEIPYQVNKSVLIEDIAKLIKDKRVQGISDLRDESDRDGLRIVIELKSNINPEVVLNQLYKHSNLRTTFSIINLALVNNQPKTLNIKQLIHEYIKHRQHVVRKRTEFDLDKAGKRAHILEGLIIALKNLDNTIAIIKKSNHVDEAKSALVEKFTLSNEQAQAILEMRLQRLTSLEQNKISDEHKSLIKIISELRAILADEQKILNIIKDELSDLKEKYGDERRTTILDKEGEKIDVEDMIEEKDVVVTISHKGYIKRMSISTYKTQKRGGKGIIAAETKQDDFIEEVFIANTHNYLLFFTDKGQVHWIKVYKIPEASRHARGLAVVNLLELKNEQVTAFIPVKEFSEKLFLCLATKKGIIKKTNLIEYSNPRKGGVRAITLDEGDELITAKMTDGNQKILIATKNGMSIKFDEKDARSIGRSAKGVKGISLKEGDEVIGMIIEQPDSTILTTTENGYGKRTSLEEYRVIGRAGIGVINIQCTERNGRVVHVSCVKDDDELMIISKKGIMIRVPVNGISIIGRNTQGVRIMKLDQDDKVVSATKIIKENNNNNNHKNNGAVKNSQKEGVSTKDNAEKTNAKEDNKENDMGEETIKTSSKEKQEASQEIREEAPGTKSTDSKEIGAPEEHPKENNQE